MTAGRVTRRSLLLSAGGALAARYARPASALAALAEDPRAQLAEQRIGKLAAGERTVALKRNADLIGVQWRGPGAPLMQLRFRGSNGRWSRWVAAGASTHGPDGASARSATPTGEPIWTGGTRLVQLRCDRALSGVVLRIVDVSGGLGARDVALAAQRSTFARLSAVRPLPLASPLLDAGAGQPPIIARAAWARGGAPPKVAPEYGAVRLAFVHHTENPNGYLAGEVPAMLRAIYAFHRYVNGWNDIGYNFVLDAYGRIFEARAGGIDEPVVGAQAGGYNFASSGIAVLGTFISQPISAAAHRSLQQLLAWKLALHGVPAQGRVEVRVNPAGAVFSRFPANSLVPLPRIAGHRDADSTECPGDALYRELPRVRSAVARLAPQPVRATLALGASTTPEATSTTTTTPTQALSGSLALLDGTPLAGASLLIQQRSVSRRGELVQETTLAQLTTDASGNCSLPIALTPASEHASIALRALYLGAAAGAGGAVGSGAAVSEPLVIAAASLTPQPAAAPTPTAAPAPPT
jgi:N-acetylmuramoyl-L-alanine amidase